MPETSELRKPLVSKCSQLNRQNCTTSENDELKTINCEICDHLRYNPHMILPPPVQSTTHKVRLAGCLRTILLLTVSGLLGLLLGVLISQSASGPGQRQGALTLWHILWVIPIFYLAVAIHELGHLLGGWLVDFRFVMLVIGPLRVMRTARSVQVSLNRTLRGVGGLAATIPRHFANLRSRLAVMIAGGPLASLLLGLVCLGLVLGAPVRQEVTHLLLVLLAFCNLGLGVASLIPMRSGGFMSDGGQLWSLWRQPALVEARQAVLMIQAASISGVRPRDWDGALLERGSGAVGQPQMHAVLELLGYLHRLDRGDVEGARVRLIAALEQLEHLPLAVRPAFCSEAAYFAARHLNDLETAQAWFERIKGGVADRQTRLRAAAAIALAAGERATAVNLAQAGITVAETSIDQGLARAETDWLKEIIDAAGSEE
jgi:hypothetical protein